MWQKFERLVGALVLIAVVMPPCLVFSQAPAVPLEDQLKAQFTLVKMGADTGGAAVVEQGTILVIKKGGILSVPYGDTSAVPTKYQDGTVHSPNNMVMKGLGFGLGKMGKTQTTRLMQVGEKVYPSKIAVSLPKDQVQLSVIACDSCNNVSPTTFYKADVIFQFRKELWRTPVRLRWKIRSPDSWRSMIAPIRAADSRVAMAMVMTSKVEIRVEDKHSNNKLPKPSLRRSKKDKAPSK
jgi:hypothetical protein